MSHHLDGVGKKITVGCLAAAVAFGVLMLLPIQWRLDTLGAVGVAGVIIGGLLALLAIGAGIAAFFDREDAGAKWMAAAAFGFFGLLIGAGITGWHVVGLVLAVAWVFSVPLFADWRTRRISQRSATRG